MIRQEPLTRVRVHLVLALLAACAALACGAARADAAVVAANGFTSEGDGYSFANYGPGARDLTAAEMVRLFGKQVCSSTAEGKCVLTPEAQAWMEATNADMAGGHCFGFATTSQLFYEHKGPFPQQTLFGASSTPKLQLQDNLKLQSYIAYAWSLQLMPAVMNSTTTLSPVGVVKQLEKDLQPGDAKHLLTIFGDGDGHAITPIAVDDAGPSLKRIAVYDNNWPGQTRFVDVNTKKNTWEYTLAPGTTWSGTAHSKSMELADPSAGLGHQPCFICAKGGKAGGPGKTMQLRLTGDARSGRHGSVTVVDKHGRKSGFGKKGLFNRIRGAELMQPTTGAPPWRRAAPPTIELPTRNAYRVHLGSTAKRGDVNEDVRLIGRGFSAGADHIAIAKGESDQLRVARRARYVSFLNDAHGIESPTIVITASNLRGGRDYQIEMEPAGINEDASIDARFVPKQQKVVLHNRNGSRVEKVAIKVVVYTKQGPQQAIRVKKVSRGKGATLKL